MRPHPFDIAPIARQIWQDKYRLVDGDRAETGVEDTFRRVARAAAAAERDGGQRAYWANAFNGAMADFGFLPAGRILAGAGSGRAVTLFNCFVMGPVGDDLGAIFDSVREAALTLQQGGGIGHDFSTLRPKGALVQRVAADASGPVSFMAVWDAMCRTIMSAGARRGAMMGTLRCDHPDIEAFIAAKRTAGSLTNFNLSVLVTEAFMAAVAADGPWDLVFGGRVYRTLPARELWGRIMQATYDYAEPGVIFIDRVNAQNNLAYCETIHATNPCGEQPLPPYGACLLGSINLARLVERPFTPDAAIDLQALDRRVMVAIRLLDNIIDVSGYPLEAQAREARAKRRLGLGVTGLADALAMCGQAYASAGGRALAIRWMEQIRNSAYAASAGLAAEKGTFPLYEREAMLSAPMMARLPAAVRERIAEHGLRNGCLTSIAPTGTISLLAGNVSSGIEPLFAIDYTRRVRDAAGDTREEQVTDYAVALFRRLHPDAPLPAVFETAHDIAPADHLAMQAALQPAVDSAISKTINCPEALPFAAFADLYQHAYDLGLKGCTTFRPNPVTGAVLTAPARPAEMSAGLAAAPAAAPAAPPTVPAVAGGRCLECGAGMLEAQEGCLVCPICGWSRCG